MLAFQLIFIKTKTTNFLNGRRPLVALQMNKCVPKYTTKINVHSADYNLLKLKCNLIANHYCLALLSVHKLVTYVTFNGFLQNWLIHFYSIEILLLFVFNIFRQCRRARNVYLNCGVPGESRIALVVTLKMTTSKQSRIGPNMAPSQPSQNMPPAIERPVKYAWPPLQRKKNTFVRRHSISGNRWLARTLWHLHKSPDQRS